MLNITKLKFERIKNDLTQSKLSRISKVNLSTIRSYEKAEKSIDRAAINTIIKLCYALNCQISDILEDEELIKMLESKRRNEDV